MKTRLLVTGATGFVGQQLIKRLADDGRFDPVAVVRKSTTEWPVKISQKVIGNLQPNTGWESALKDIDVVIHLAARVHIMNDTVGNPLLAFRKANTEATSNLAKQAAREGVKRFIFISSIKVNGESTRPALKFKADDKVRPSDPYAISKFEAEQELFIIAEKCAMDVVIIRPPLVYGPGVKANFAKMMKWVSKGIPLPLGAVHNQRSLLALDNLVDFIIHCIDHPKAANEVFLISDGEDVSTTQLILKIAKSLQKRAWLVPVPEGVMKSFAKLMGKGDQIDRLLGNLQIDNSKAQRLLNWKPVISMNEQLKKIAMEYK